MVGTWPAGEAVDHQPHRAAAAALGACLVLDGAAMRLDVGRLGGQFVHGLLPKGC